MRWKKNRGEPDQLYLNSLPRLYLDKIMGDLSVTHYLRIKI